MSQNQQKNKIYIGNLSFSVSSDELRDAFAKYGDITEATIIKERDTGRSKGFGFVTFSDESAATSALEADGTSIKDRPIRVSIAKDEKGGRRGGGGRRDDDRRGY